MLFRSWEKNHKNDDSNHLNIIKKLNKDKDRLDRTIDKIKTEKKAKDIFAYGKQQNSQIVVNNLVHPVQVVHQVHPVHTLYPIQSVHQVLPVHTLHSVQLIQKKYIEPQYIIVNGHIVSLQNNY